MTHSDLVSAAAKCLQKTCAVVITEMATTGETPDVIGWRGVFSTVVECKTSRADFAADRGKKFRAFPENGMGYFRYYFAPDGLLNPDEMPNGWGLMELRGNGKVRVMRESGRFHDYNARQEIGILLSAFRRVGSAPNGVSVKFYTIQTQCKATLGVLPEEVGIQS